MSNFVLYLIGAILVIAALAYGASQLGINSTWIIVGAVLILGIAIMAGVKNTRRPEKSQVDK